MKKFFNNPIIKFVMTVFKVALIFQLVVLVVFVNFNVDVSNFYHPGGEDDVAAQLLQEGHTLDYYDNLNERRINGYYIQRLEEPLDTVAFGSSRILQLTKESIHSNSFYNFGVSGGDFEDMVNTFFLLEEADKLPQNIIIGLDHWIFNPQPDAASPRSDKNLYMEFLHTKFGIQQDYVKRDEVVVDYAPLFDAAYFQGNLSFLIENKGLPNRTPSIVEADFENYPRNIKSSDGTIIYSKEFRDVSDEDILNRAQAVASAFPGMDGLDSLYSGRLELFEKFISYIQSCGVNVVFVLSPFHPFVYNYISYYSDIYSNFFKIEPWVASFAKDNNIPVFGSYNPYLVGCLNQDFFDGWHIKPESLACFAPNISAVAKTIKSGKIETANILLENPISEEFAKKIIFQTYPAPEDEYNFIDKGTREIEGEDYYIYARYKGDSLIDTFAVNTRTGYLLRLEKGRWVNEYKF